jgi:hypothetical protein
MATWHTVTTALSVSCARVGATQAAACVGPRQAVGRASGEGLGRNEARYSAPIYFFSNWFKFQEIWLNF